MGGWVIKYVTRDNITGTLSLVVSDPRNANLCFYNMVDIDAPTAGGLTIKIKSVSTKNCPIRRYPEPNHCAHILWGLRLFKKFKSEGW